MIARIPCSSLYLTHVPSITLDKPWPFSACHFASSWFQRVQEFSWRFYLYAAYLTVDEKFVFSSRSSVSHPLFLQDDFTAHSCFLLFTRTGRFITLLTPKLLKSVWESGLMYSGDVSSLICIMAVSRHVCGHPIDLTPTQQTFCSRSSSGKWFSQWTYLTCPRAYSCAI